MFTCTTYLPLPLPICAGDSQFASLEHNSHAQFAPLVLYEHSRLASLVQTGIHHACLCVRYGRSRFFTFVRARHTRFAPLVRFGHSQVAYLSSIRDSHFAAVRAVTIRASWCAEGIGDSRFWCGSAIDDFHLRYTTGITDRPRMNFRYVFSEKQSGNECTI